MLLPHSHVCEGSIKASLGQMGSLIPPPLHSNPRVSTPGWLQCQENSNTVLSKPHDGMIWDLEIPQSNPPLEQVPYSRLHRKASSWVLNISREGDSTSSLGSLFQCSVTLKVKKFFLLLRWNSLYSHLCPLPLVLSLGTVENSLAHLLDIHPLDIYKH